MKYFRIWNPLLLAAAILAFAGLAHGKAIYVSTTGSDATSYASNDATHPWLTVDKMFKETQGGDSALFYAGNYNITATVDNRITGNDGTHANPITVMPKPGESTVTWTAVPTSVNPVIELERKYWHIKKINCVGGYDFFRLGWNSSTNRDGFSLDSMTWTCDYGNDNQAFLYGTPLSDSAIVQNCTFNGPGNIADPRTAAVIMFQTKVFTIRNNVVKDMKIGIFHKHGNTENNGSTRANTNILIYGNIVTGYLNQGINISSRWAVLRNNIVGPGFTSGAVSLRVGEDGGFVGGDSNTIEHNTFMQGTEFLYDTRAGDQIPGSIGNIYKNNILRDYWAVHQFTSVPHFTTVDYNLYPNVTHLVFNNSTDYTLAGWKIAYGQDVHSIAQTPTFTGTPGTTISDYRLQSSSFGYHAASDGLDMGANVDSVGIGAGSGGGGGGATRYFRLWWEHMSGGFFHRLGGFH